MDNCGFRLKDLCCCEDMECYGTLCTYMDTINCCPVHFDPGENDTGDDERMSVHILYIHVYKREIEELKAQIELRDKMIDKLAHCIADPCFGGNL